MLKSNYQVQLTPFDLVAFEVFVPADHFLRRLKATIDFAPARTIVADCYSPDQGRGAIDPVCLLKFSLLQFHYDLSDDNVIRQAEEERAHSNNIESLSIDGVGFNGAVLKALSDDADGPQLTVFVPPKKQPPRYPDLFQTEDFPINQAGDEVACPNGETTCTRNRDGKNHGWIYHFRQSQCSDCPLRSQCLPAQNRGPRKVSKNDFQPQYEVARQRATTTEYKKVRQQHPAIERKLNELVRWHNGRRVRYRGRLRVKVQYLLLGIVVNCKRIVRLLTAAPAAQPA